jgi:cyclophilin family peptidyl-prolyl cis-trans isomerase
MNALVKIGRYTNHQTKGAQITHMKLIAIFLCATIFIGMTTISLAQSKADTTKVVISTNLGDITVLLYERESPISVKNFLAYADTGFYGGLIFHRVIPNFMVQGGGFSKNMMKRQTVFPPIKNESDNRVKNERGTLAMARTQDPHSATSQFFINVVDNASLDISAQGWGYAVFGKVIEGMELVDKIAATKTQTVGAFRDVPVEPIIIVSIRRK